MTPLIPPDPKRQNRELEERIRVAGERYEQYLLEEAYEHAAMLREQRRKTRAEALKLPAKAPVRPLSIVRGKKPSAT
jgi:hypothetical protein